MTAEPCPVDGCPRLRNGEMCRAHWRKVSPATRAAVWATWKAWRANFADAANMKAYTAAARDARDEATGADLLAGLT